MERSAQLGAARVCSNRFKAFPADGDETAKYKAIAALFDRTTPLYQKAMANRVERAHGRSMSHHARFQLLQIHAGRRS
jgi:hypothetical protein